MPVSESARTWLNKRFGEREIYIGLDAAVALGHPAVISTALILVPITVLLAVILPGNQVLPFGDLATIPFVVAFIVGAARGNIIHSVIVGTIMIAISLYIATDVAPIFTDMAKGTNVQMPKGSSEISSMIKVVISLTILSLNYLVYSIKNRGVCGESFSKTREGHGNLELLDKEVATPLDDKVKIKVHYAGICGTDIHTYEGHYKVNFPVTLGHEFSGEIVEVGADVKDFKVGDRVTSETTFYVCNECEYCKSKTIIYATIEKVLEHKLMAHLLIMSLHVKKVCIIFQMKYRISLQL